MKKCCRYLVCLLCIGLLGLAGITWADKPAAEEIQPGVYPLIPITNHTPGVFKDSKEYTDSLQKVELEIGKQDQFRDLPKLGMKNPYTGTIKLGDGKYGVIVDIVGEEKRLYIDRKGDGSFANETWTPLLNQWYGLQIYWVIGPEPVTLQAKFNTPSQVHPIEIEVQGLLNKPGTLVQDKPFLLVKVRTWFMAKIQVDGMERLVAIADRNNNGRFNDPEDQIFVDYNDDGNFDKEEMMSKKNGVSIKSGTQKLPVDWTVYPDKLVIGGGK